MVLEKLDWWCGNSKDRAGQDWYDPDEFAREIHTQFPEKHMQQINSAVWSEGLRRLKTAICDKSHFTFETTLGDITITLFDAIAAGVPVNIWYCDLASVDLHIEQWLPASRAVVATYPKI